MTVGEEKEEKMQQQAARPGAGLHPSLAGREQPSSKKGKKTRQPGTAPTLGRPASEEGREASRGLRPGAGRGPAGARELGREGTRRSRSGAGLSPARPAGQFFFFYFL